MKVSRLARGGDAMQVALQQRGEGFLRLPFGMLGREGLNTINEKEDLGVNGLLGPQRPVVVEHGDALGLRHKIRRAFLSDLFDEGDDGFLRRGVVPRGERVIRGSCNGNSQ